jgi:predicted RNA-binding protein with PIN domain
MRVTTRGTGSTGRVSARKVLSDADKQSARIRKTLDESNRVEQRSARTLKSASTRKRAS